MFEDPFGRSPEWIKFAEPRSDNALRFPPSREQGMAYPPNPNFAEPSSDRRFEKFWRRGILLPLLTSPLLCVNR